SGGGRTGARAPERRRGRHLRQHRDGVAGRGGGGTGVRARRPAGAGRGARLPGRLAAGVLPGPGVSREHVTPGPLGGIIGQEVDMLLTLSLVLASATPVRPIVFRPGDAPVHVWLNNDGRFAAGDHARASVRFVDDGYLLVLAMDVEGRVRVLFPIDPGAD